MELKEDTLLATNKRSMNAKANIDENICIKNENDPPKRTKPKGTV
jgi:hypothetical protein